MPIQANKQKGFSLIAILSGIVYAFVLLCIIVFIIPIHYALAYIPDHEPRKNPKLNPHPEHFVKIYGHVDKGLDVTLTSGYATYNDKCQITTNWFEGATDDRYSYFNFHISPDKHGNYSITLPKDKLKRGYCKWQFVGIGYKVKNNKTQQYTEGSLISADKSEAPPSNPRLNFICKDKNYSIKCGPSDSTSDIFLGLVQNINDLEVNYINHIKEIS